MTHTKPVKVFFTGVILFIMLAGAVMAQANLAGDWIENGVNHCVITQRGADYFFSNLSLSSTRGARGRFRDSSTVVTDGGWGGGSAVITNNGNEIHWANGIIWRRSGSTNNGTNNSTNPFSPVLAGQNSNPYGTNYNNTCGTTTNNNTGGTNYNNTGGTNYNNSINLSGSWVQNVDGASCEIDQQKHSIHFKNLSGAHIKGKGHFNGPAAIVMENDFGGGSATVTHNGNRILWANGIVWSRRR
jgi:hypothetical protein